MHTLDTDPDPVYDQSVFVDNLQLIDPVLLNNKLGDTCTGVPGRLLGKSQFYTETSWGWAVPSSGQSGDSSLRSYLCMHVPLADIYEHLKDLFNFKCLFKITTVKVCLKNHS